MRIVFFLAVFTLSLFGCEEGSNDIAKGRKAANKGNYSEALELFDKALKSDPDNYNALWGKADVFRRDGSLAKQAEVLEHIVGSDKQNLKDFAHIAKKALEINYRKQADALVGGDMDKAESLMRKAIALNKKSEANASLADLLGKKGDSLLRKKDFKGAKTAFDEAIKLRVTRKDRSKLKGKAEIAGFLGFKADFEPKFEKHKAQLITDKIYDPKKQIFLLTGVAEIEEKSDAPDYAKNAERDGLVAVTSALAELTFKLAEKPRPEGKIIPYESALVTVVAKGFEKPAKKKDPVKFSYQISLPENAVFEKVFEVQSGKFDGPAKPAKAVEAPVEADKKPAEADKKPAKATK